MEFSRQKYWSGLPFPFPGDLPNPGIEPWPPALQADSLLSEPPGKLISQVLCLVAQSCLTLCDPMDCILPGSSVHGDSPGKNPGVGCHFLLQGIFLTQGWNLCFLHGQADSLPLGYLGSFRPEERPLGSNTVKKGLVSSN